MSVLPVGFGSSGGIDTGDIGHSLRFRSAASAYISKTITTDTTSTYFAAVKRGKLGVISPIFDTNIKFNANDTLTAFGLTTTAVFRDPTSWLFIHVSNGGLYVNGVSYGAVTTSALTNPRIGYDGTNYFDGYIARIGCVAGSSSAYTNFGYLNTDINEWVTKSQSAVKAVVDAGGTNSFMLDFDDATSLTTLGYDKSSKGNNWTLNNFSLTAGTTYDHMLDVPGNSYATLNPLKAYNLGTIADGNLSHTKAAAASRLAGTISIGSTDLIYLEFTRTDATGVGNNVAFGITTTDAALSTSAYSGAPTNSGATASEWVLTDRGYACNGSTYTNLTATLGTFGQNDVGRVAVNRVTGKVWFGKNATWSGDPAAGTGEAFSNVTVDVQPLSYAYGGTMRFNTGQRPLAQSAPTGFKALCQANLPTGTVTVSGTFTGNASADGPCVWMNGVPKTLTINGNAVTFGTHADKLAAGFKLRTSSASYNTAGSNTWTATIDSNLQNIFKYNNAEGNP